MEQTERGQVVSRMVRLCSAEAAIAAVPMVAAAVVLPLGGLLGWWRVFGGASGVVIAACAGWLLLAGMSLPFTIGWFSHRLSLPAEARGFAGLGVTVWMVVLAADLGYGAFQAAVFHHDDSLYRASAHVCLTALLLLPFALGRSMGRRRVGPTEIGEARDAHRH